MADFGTLMGTFAIAANSASSSNIAVLTSGSGLVETGDLVFAVFGQQTGLTVTAVADSMGHNYTATNIGTDAGSMSGRAFYTRMTSNGTLTSLTGSAVSSANNITFIAAVFKGPFDEPPVDANVSNITAGSAGTSYTCPATGTMGQAIDLVIGWMARGAATAFTATAPNLLAIQLASQTVAQAVIGYQTTINSSSFSPVFTSGATAGVRVLGTTTFKLSNDILLGQGIL